jgi:hypothetical protein
MPPERPISKTVRVLLALGYLLGLPLIYACYADQRHRTDWVTLAGALSPLFILLILISALLILGSLWFWRWSTARAFLLLFFIHGIAILLVTRIADAQWNAEVQRNLAYADTLVLQIENYQKTNGHYAATWTDLGLTNPPVIHRHRTTVPIGYAPATNATYQLVLPYGHFRYLYHPTTRQWEMHD